MGSLMKPVSNIQPPSLGAGQPAVQVSLRPSLSQCLFLPDVSLQPRASTSLFPDP